MIELEQYEFSKCISAFEGVVIPKHFWNKDTCHQCIGFIVIKNHQHVAIAFSSCIEGNQLEIGIETKEVYRNQGYGTVAAKALIAYCLENSFEPVWSCKHDNLSSVNTAKKLGFMKTFEGPYYEIMKKF